MQVSDLQSNLTVSSSRIAGTLKYVTDFTAFSGDPAEQQGNYMALKFEAPEGSTTTIQMIGLEPVNNPTTLDSDMNAVIRVRDASKQKLRVVTSMDGAEDVVRVFHLAGLKCLPSA